MTLAERLWERADAHPQVRRLARSPLSFTVTVFKQPLSSPLPREEWSIGADDVEFSLGKCLRGRIECARGQLTGSVSADLVAREPALVARLLLETPASVLLSRRAYAVVHAGVVAGPAGGIVIRGVAGSGKSTLVAAAHKAGLEVLGDETVLVARDYPNELLAAVREVTVLPEAADLLKLPGELAPATGAGEVKLRLDLFRSSQPSVRRARRLATVVLGPRDTGAARLEPLTPDVFLAEFGRGAIPQERWSNTPSSIAAYWAKDAAYRLSGAADLRGAVGLLEELVDSGSTSERDT